MKTLSIGKGDYNNYLLTESEVLTENFKPRPCRSDSEVNAEPRFSGDFPVKTEHARLIISLLYIFLLGFAGP